MSIENLATLQVNKLSGQLLGAYNALGVSTAQSPVDALLSLAKSNVIPDIYSTLFSTLSGASSKGNSQNTTKDGTELDDRHKITIYSKYEQSKIVCPIQEQIQIKLESKWKSAIPEGFSSALGGAEALFQVFGFSSQLPTFTRRMWAGSEPLRLRVPLKFQAVRSAIFDVMTPVSTLMKLVLPKLKGKVTKLKGDVKLSYSLLAPPGPSPFKEFTAGDIFNEEISILIGTFAFFRNVIIKEVTTEFDSKLDSSGYPISAKVDVDFETYEYWTADQVDSTFKTASSLNVASSITGG